MINILRQIFRFLDFAVYSLISTVFSMAFTIANMEAFEEMAGKLMGRVYGVLAAYIVIKLIISAIQYIANPDSMLDKKKGVSGIFSRTAFSLCLIALVPEIFSFARSLQNELIPVIPAVILGMDVDVKSGEFYSLGDSLARMVLGRFVSIAGESGDKGFIFDKLSRGNSNQNGVSGFLEDVNSGCAIFDGGCDFEYQWYFSFPVGLGLVYLILNMCFDIAIRSFKLLILQVFAPIPIATYIESDEKFKKWYTMCQKVYIDLFIRLSLIMFLIYFFREVLTNISELGGVLFPGAGNQNFLELSVGFIIILYSLFLFVKQAPNFISDAFGLNVANGDMLSMFKPDRLTGAFAGAGNIARNTFRAGRAALANNNDMGGFHRLTNTLRRAAMGALDSSKDFAVGAYNGEGWKKMNARADAANKRRTQNIVENSRKRLNKKEEKRLKRQLEELGGNSRIKNFEYEQQAKSAYDREIVDMQSEIQAEKSKLARATGRIEKENIMNSIREKQSELAKLQTKQGRKDYIKKKTEEIKIDSLYSERKSELRNARDNANSILESARKNYEGIANSPNVSAAQKEAAFQAYMAAQSQYADAYLKYNEIEDEVKGKEEFTRQYKDAQNSYDAMHDFRRDAGQTVVSSAMNYVKEGWGAQVVNSSTINDFASKLGSMRSSSFTGESMTQVQKNPRVVNNVFVPTDSEKNAIIVDKNKRAALETAFGITTTDAGELQLTYSQAVQLYKEYASNPVAAKEKYGIDSDYADQIMRFAEKNAATEYINRVVNGEIRNAKIETEIHNIDVLMSDPAIPKSIIKKIISDCGPVGSPKFYGEFLARGSDYAEILKKSSDQFSNAESQKNNNSNS